VATFPKQAGSHGVATFAWADGVVATTPMWGSSERLPHDLGHYLTEAWFTPPYGFWSLMEQQLPLASMTLVRGRWPKGAAARWEEVRRSHGTDLLKAEATDLSDLARPGVDLVAEWPAIRRVLERSYVFTEANPFAGVTIPDLQRFANRGRALRNLWRRVPGAGALEVSWPPQRPVMVQAGVGSRMYVARKRSSEYCTSRMSKPA